MPGRRFCKVEGLANDFVLVDGRWETDDESERVAWWQRRAERLCHRRRGIGADGILLVVSPGDPAALARMVVINRDGSRPEMCGNGIRCVAHHLAMDTARTTFSVETDAGSRACTVVTSDDEVAEVAVDMGPATLDGGLQTFSYAPGLAFRSVDVGNPHAVTFVDDVPSLLTTAQALGLRVSTQACYPRGTNVEFAAVRPDGTLTAQVWERGVGLTQACGTGACAVAVAAAQAGLVPTDRAVSVHLPGGALSIELTTAGEGFAVRMTGPARRVFQGEFTAS
ncbi:MAG: diaminopimelate epimerase [Myxococcales bacterium FL481]|nr:MAG: diaminopimelate epimerase [Myxococcales bacterium FL481]